MECGSKSEKERKVCISQQVTIVSNHLGLNLTGDNWEMYFS